MAGSSRRAIGDRRRRSETLREGHHLAFGVLDGPPRREAEVQVEVAAAGTTLRP